MTGNGGAKDGASRRLVVVDPATEPQAADVPAAVRRLRAASLDAQWHNHLDAVFASCFASVES